jgi:NAD(P)-dependent dehydrogenase (short-subunit alcohol dehydrogenase family)
MKTALVNLLVLLRTVDIVALIIPTKQSCIVIGGSGTIGFEISKILSENLHNDWRSSFRKHETRERDALNKIKKRSAFELELYETDRLQLPTFLAGGPHPIHYILINCAGVCLPGSSAEVMERTIKINTISPIKLAKLAIQKYTRACEGRDLLSIVNVSSGEGELSFLHTRIAERIRSIQSITECDQYVEKLFRTYDSSTEYAHGSTPMYSLSKALLNKYTQLLHEDCRRTDTGRNIQIIACCPGNVASPMSTQEELRTAVPARHAAERILRLATDFEAFPGGKFYRDGQEIPW